MLKPERKAADHGNQNKMTTKNRGDVTISQMEPAHSHYFTLMAVIPLAPNCR
jgi:hypothetical protein